MRIGIAITGSFCTLNKTLNLIETFRDMGHDILPIFSFNVSKLDTRFFEASIFRERVNALTNIEIIDSIEGAEPIGPKNLCDAMILLPCTGNTLAKIAGGITDTPVTMAVKSHVRNNKKVLVALATNDALGASFSNIAKLYNTKNFYFVPLIQDNIKDKPKSLVYREDKVVDAFQSMLNGESLPLFDK